jgi:hypothetical protein
MIDTTTVDRSALIERITARLADVDDDTLREIDLMSQLGSVEAPPIARPAVLTPLPAQLSRRELLVGLVTGGAAVAGTGVVAGWAGLSRGRQQGIVEGRAAVEAELAKVRGLLTLYEALENVGLDDILAAGLAAVGRLLGGLAAGAGALRDAIAAIDSALTRFEASLPTVRQGLATVQRLIDDLLKQLDALRLLLAQTTQRIQPLGDALGGFLSGVLEHLPFGVGDRTRQVFDALGKLISTLPEMLRAMINGLLTPLADWFPAEGAGGVEAGLFTPLRQSLLARLSQYLDDAATLFDQWEVRLAGPAQKALAERAHVRQQIADYRRANNV